jgi:hypothetical protein
MIKEGNMGLEASKGDIGAMSRFCALKNECQGTNMVGGKTGL